jgi:hypothetical protein
MKSVILTCSLFLATAVGFSQQAFADFPLTPGTATTGSLCNRNDTDFTEYRYEGKIPYCQRNVSRDQKRKIYDYYGVPTRCRSEYTIDHFIPLSIGGTNRPNNLWPEAKVVKRLRQNLELELFDEIRNGTITQAEAIKTIREAKLNPPVTDPNQLAFCL